MPPLPCGCCLPDLGVLLWWRIIGFNFPSFFWCVSFSDVWRAIWWYHGFCSHQDAQSDAHIPLPHPCLWGKGAQAGLLGWSKGGGGGGQGVHWPNWPKFRCLPPTTTTPPPPPKCCAAEGTGCRTQPWGGGGGDVRNEQHVLGQCHIQFGLFKGRTFLWLVENALGYGAFIVDKIIDGEAAGGCQEKELGQPDVPRRSCLVAGKEGGFFGLVTTIGEAKCTSCHELSTYQHLDRQQQHLLLHHPQEPQLFHGVTRYSPVDSSASRATIDVDLTVLQCISQHLPCDLTNWCQFFMCLSSYWSCQSESEKLISYRKIYFRIISDQLKSVSPKVFWIDVSVSNVGVRSYQSTAQ